jgi:hypothetical protein
MAQRQYQSLHRSCRRADRTIRADVDWSLDRPRCDLSGSRQRDTATILLETDKYFETGSLYLDDIVFALRDSTPPPTYSLTMVNGTDNTGASPYQAGTVVTITADPPPQGEEFASWTDDCLGCVTFASATSASTTLTMPGATVTVTATYQEVGNQPPVAVLATNPDPATIDVDDTVLFDGAGSYDVDGPIVLYAWDLDGNGSFETTTTAATTSRQYTVAEVVNVKFKVQDNLDVWSAEVTKTVTVNSPGGGAPQAPSNVTIAGTSTRNRITYSDNSTDETFFKFSRQMNGGAWNDSFGQKTGDSTTGTEYWDDTNVTAGNTYCYRVRAYSPNGESASVPDLPGVCRTP